MPDATVDPRLAELREEIGRIDRALVVLVAARLRAARRAIERRVDAGEEVTDGAQELVVVDRARRWADELGVSPEFVERLMRVLIRAGKVWAEPDGRELPSLPDRVSCRLTIGSGARRPSRLAPGSGPTPEVVRPEWEADGLSSREAADSRPAEP